MFLAHSAHEQLVGEEGTDVVRESLRGGYALIALKVVAGGKHLVTGGEQRSCIRHRQNLARATDSGHVGLKNKVAGLLDLVTDLCAGSVCAKLLCLAVDFGSTGLVCPVFVRASW